MEKGTIILLDGSPSSGKTTIARIIQNNARVPYLYAGIDTFTEMLPQRWISCSMEFTQTEGLEFVYGKDESGKTTIKLGMGVYAENLILGYINAVKGLAEAGNHVIADGVITKKEWLEHIERCFAGIKTCFVGLYAPLHVLEEREIFRWLPQDMGQARGRFEEVYALQKEYDIFIDTSKKSPEEASKCILQYFENK